VQFVFVLTGHGPVELLKVLLLSTRLFAIALKNSTEFTRHAAARSSSAFQANREEQKDGDDTGSNKPAGHFTPRKTLNVMRRLAYFQHQPIPVVGDRECPAITG
jgi:hypothetical protein